MSTYALIRIASDYLHIAILYRSAGDRVGMRRNALRWRQCISQL